jgi:RNA recognition motif-containing protein
MTLLLIVDHLPSQLSDEELVGLFRPFGHVLSCRIVRDLGGRSLNYAFVEFDRPKAASDAIRALDGKQVDDHSISVTPVKDSPAGAV